MPYEYTSGPLDLLQALYEAFEGAVEILSEVSVEHGSRNVYYRLAAPSEANCTVLPVTDARIKWPYINGLRHGTTCFAKRC